MRKSLKDKRDPVEFEREQKIQAFLHQQVAAGKLLILHLNRFVMLQRNRQIVPVNQALFEHEFRQILPRF